jgi:hypothetical protein
MYPLIVVGRFGELIDSRLVDEQPVRQADFPSFQRFRIVD